MMRVPAGAGMDNQITLAMVNNRVTFVMMDNGITLLVLRVDTQGCALVVLVVSIIALVAGWLVQCVLELAAWAWRMWRG